MADRQLPPAGVLRQLLSYDPDTGKLFWKKRDRSWFSTNRGHAIWNARYSETEAFTCYDAYGYKQGNLFNRRTKAHRLIWAYENGDWPEHDVDHINGVRDDNRIANLRAVTRLANLRNCCVRSDNTSGIVGVDQKPDGKWRARIGVKLVGTFATKDEAISARRAAEVAHGFHPNHGRKAATQGG